MYRKPELNSHMCMGDCARVKKKYPDDIFENEEVSNLFGQNRTTDQAENAINSQNIKRWFGDK